MIPIIKGGAVGLGQRKKLIENVNFTSCSNVFDHMVWLMWCWRPADEMKYSLAMLEWCDEHIHNTEVLNLMKVSKQIFKDRSSKNRQKNTYKSTTYLNWYTKCNSNSMGNYFSLHCRISSRNNILHMPCAKTLQPPFVYNLHESRMGGSIGFELRWKNRSRNRPLVLALDKSRRLKHHIVSFQSVT